MPTPDSIRSQYHLPQDYLPHHALVEVAFRDERVKAFHRRAGVAVVAALSSTSSNMESVIQTIVFTDDTSPYLAAIKSIQALEQADLIDKGSTVSAFAELHAATFDSSDWAEYLSEDEV